MFCLIDGAIPTPSEQANNSILVLQVEWRAALGAELRLRTIRVVTARTNHMTCVERARVLCESVQKRVHRALARKRACLPRDSRCDSNQSARSGSVPNLPTRNR